MLAMTNVLTLTALATIAVMQLRFIAEAKECTSMPPGADKMSSGVDITTLDLLPMEGFDTSGFESPVVKLSCDKGRTWKSPNGKVYDLPDQIWKVTPVPGGWMTADSKMYTSSKQLKESIGADVGAEVNLKKFAFSASLSYVNMQNTITNTSKFISDVGAFFSANIVELQPSNVLTLDDETKKSVDNDLKGTYETNPETYNAFIKTYGTHYFYRASFGGYLRAIYETESKYVFTHKEDSVKFNAKASFMNTVSVSTGVSHSKETVDEEFTKSSKDKIKYYGGESNLLKKGNGLDEWQPTVANNPWLFSGKLKPISDLISDETKKRSMERAVEQYVLRSYIGEMERLLTYAKSKTNDAVINSLQERVQNLKNTKVLVMKDVEAVGDAIDYEIKLPSWFTKSTNFCFRWSATHDSSQCGRGVSSDLCAAPNSMTQYYKDDTDIRIGGCKMEWGLKSEGYPDWFNGVQVCFWYGPDGDKCQCGEKGDPKTYCSSINSFTYPYLDDTDARIGGCKMSWKLVVPSNAPLWMRTSKMCFQWYPGVDWDECGAGVSRDMCYTANEWTPEYLDNTKDFGDGCFMSWGIKTVFV